MINIASDSIMAEKKFPFSTHLSRKIEIFQNMEHVVTREKKTPIVILS